MSHLVNIGASMALGGLAGIIWCIVTVLRARRAKLDEAAMTAVMRRVITVNLVAFAISAVGLGAVVAGLLLG